MPYFLLIIICKDYNIVLSSSEISYLPRHFPPITIDCCRLLPPRLLRWIHWRSRRLIGWRAPAAQGKTPAFLTGSLQPVGTFITSYNIQKKIT